MELVFRQSALTSFASPSLLPRMLVVVTAACYWTDSTLQAAKPIKCCRFHRGLGFWGREFNSLRSASCSRTEPSEGRFIFLFFYFFCLYDSVWIVAFSDMHLFIAARFYVPHSAASERSFGLFTFPLCHPPFTSHLFFPPEIVLSPLLQTSVRLASSSSSLSSLPSLSSPSSLPFFPLPPSNVFPQSV